MIETVGLMRCIAFIISYFFWIITLAFEFRMNLLEKMFDVDSLHDMNYIHLIDLTLTFGNNLQLVAFKQV